MRKFLTLAGMFMLVQMWCAVLLNAATAGDEKEALPPSGTNQITGQHAEPGYYFWETAFTLRNSRILQKDGSTRHVLVLRSVDGHTPAEPPTVYYSIEPRQRPLRHRTPSTAAGAVPRRTWHRARPKLENGAWRVETAVGIQSRLTVHAKICDQNKTFFASITLPVWLNAKPGYVPPPEAEPPADWPDLRVQSPSGDFFDRTGMPLTLVLDKKHHQDNGQVMLVDGLRNEKTWLAFSEAGDPSAGQRLNVVPPDDPVLNASPSYTKHLTWIVPLSDGGSISLTSEMNRNWQTHTRRKAGFVTAGIGFGSALAFALAMRCCFKEPHKRFKRDGHAD